MITDLVLPVWTAVFEALDENVVVDGKTIAVRETPDPGEPYPYVTFKVEMSAGDTEHKALGGVELSAWGNNGAAELLAILTEAGKLISRKKLPTSIGKAVCLFSTLPSVGRGEDGTLRHAVQAFRVLVHE